MSEADRPIDISPFVEEARAFAYVLVRRVSFEAIILDDWNTGEARGPRLIYCADFMSVCDSKCESCSVFSAVGEDVSSNEFKFRTSLCRATSKQLALFPSKQRYLNCKTLPQYLLAFVTWFVEECNTRESLEAELDWVRGFRVLFLRDFVGDDDKVSRREAELKQDIVLKVLARLDARGDTERLCIVSLYAKKIGLII